MLLSPKASLHIGVYLCLFEMFEKKDRLLPFLGEAYLFNV